MRKIPGNSSTQPSHSTNNLNIEIMYSRIIQPLSTCQQWLLDINSQWLSIQHIHVCKAYVYNIYHICLYCKYVRAKYISHSPVFHSSTDERSLHSNFRHRFRPSSSGKSGVISNNGWLASGTAEAEGSVDGAEALPLALASSWPWKYLHNNTGCSN